MALRHQKISTPRLQVSLTDKSTAITQNPSMREQIVVQDLFRP